MRRIRLIHRDSTDAAKRTEALRAAGYEVAHDGSVGPATVRAIRDDPPAAVVIDMSRIPSQGRDLGLALRHHRGTRHVPLVFAGGDPEKIDRVKRLLPDAVYTPWSRIRSSLRRAIAHPPAEPVAPRSLLAGYEGTPLPKKTSGVPSDITQNDVRAVGLAAGLVDYKICSIDDTWSGLRFARRKRT